MIKLKPAPLTQEVFAPFGDVIETENRDSFPINNGSTQRFHQLANIQLDEQGAGIISIFRAQKLTMPYTIKMLEKHPLGSQAFMPLRGVSFLVVVAKKGKGNSPHPETVKAFITNGQQGVNYHRDTWHHPILALHDGDEFLVIDRAGIGNNCDEYFFPEDGPTILLSP